jgi:2,3-bisphosphoglycerate-dependent phosphoglycerate mutase
MDRVFYIFRHGETDWNKERRTQGHTNTPLNENGLRQADELALKLRTFPLEVIYSSDLDRAQMTGKAVSDQKQIPLIIDSRLREMSYGKIEGMLFAEAVELFGDEFKKLQSFKRAHDHVKFPEGETRHDSRIRFQSLIYDIIEKTDFSHIGISTHGGAIRNFLHYYLDEDYPILPIPNCVVYRCTYNVSTKKFLVETTPI